MTRTQNRHLFGSREASTASREGLGGYLADRGWMARVLDQTYENMGRLAVEGRYPFPVVDGVQVRTGVQGRRMHTSALARTESRGMDKREDHPATDPGQWHRLVTGGRDEVWVRTEPVPAALPVAS